MPETKITDLSSVGTPSESLELVTEDGAVTRKLTVGQVVDVVDARGKVGVEATNGSSQTLADDTWVDLEWSAESYDHGGLHSTSTDPEKITVTEGGFYAVSASVVFDTSSAGQRECRFQVNGTDARAWQTVDAASSGATRLAGTWLYLLSADDEITFQAKQNSGGNLDATATNVAVVRVVKV